MVKLKEDASNRWRFFYVIKWWMVFAKKSKQ